MGTRPRCRVTHDPRFDVYRVHQVNSVQRHGSRGGGHKANHWQPARSAAPVQPIVLHLLLDQRSDPLYQLGAEGTTEEGDNQPHPVIPIFLEAKPA